MDIPNHDAAEAQSVHRGEGMHPLLHKWSSEHDSHGLLWSKCPGTHAKLNNSKEYLAQEAVKHHAYMLGPDTDNSR